MATVRQRKSGRWQVIVQARQPDGTRRQESRTFDTETEARLHAHRLPAAVSKVRTQRQRPGKK